ncbi:3-deoxy-D-manno-octulosonic acid transferase, partial [bacterium]|nr:3-deoxy-D-manno-octulosonic acid transferase [bacterium]
PAVYGIPVFFGPEYYMAQEAISLVQRQGGHSVTSSTEFERFLDSYLKDKNIHQTDADNSQRLVDRGLGATERIVNYIGDYLRK